MYVYIYIYIAVTTMIDESLHVVKSKELILLAKKCFKCFYHSSFLESFYSYQVASVGLRIKKPRVYLLFLKTLINLGEMLCRNLNLN